MILLDYRCSKCASVFEALSDRPGFERLSCDAAGCDGIAERIISPVRLKPEYASVTRGKVEEPPPGGFSTLKIAKRYGLA